MQVHALAHPVRHWRQTVSADGQTAAHPGWSWLSDWVMSSASTNVRSKLGAQTLSVNCSYPPVMHPFCDAAFLKVNEGCSSQQPTLPPFPPSLNTCSSAGWTFRCVTCDCWTLPCWWHLAHLARRAAQRWVRRRAAAGSCWSETTPLCWRWSMYASLSWQTR